MTLGEKIQTARKQAGLTQEQLARKLFVTRAAVAKWETDAGTPDVQNLKALALLFNTPMENLLNDDLEISRFGFREDLQTDDPDAAAASRFPEAYWVRRAALLHGLGKVERFFNVLTFGLVAVMWSVKHADEFKKHYFVAETGDVQYFIVIDAESITTTPLPHRVQKTNEFCIDGRTYLI